MAFLHLRKTSFDSRREVENLRLFFVTGLVDLGRESLNFSNAPILEKRCNFTLWWLLDLGNTSIEQNLRMKTCCFFISCLAAPWLTFGYYWGNSLTHLMLIIVFGLSIFIPKVTRRGWVFTLNWVPSGLWSIWHNPLTHSSQFAENTLPRLAPSFSKMWKFPKYTKQL